MLHNIGNSKPVVWLERALDATTQRQQLIAQNLANVNTPHYKRVDLDFQGMFEEALQADKNELEMARTHPMHYGTQHPDGLPKAPRITRETKTDMRYDENNVDVEFEMAQASENALFYQALTTSWKKKMSGIRTAIQGR